MIIGSTYFFKDIEGFKPKDIDTLELVDNPKDFKYSYQLTGHGKCVFKWKKCLLLNLSKYHYLIIVLWN